MMIDAPHRGDQPQPAVVEVDSHPLGQLDVDRWWRNSTAACRSVGEDMMIRRMHTIRVGGETSGGAVFVPCTSRRTSGAAPRNG